jgi:hypothetical protein
MGRGELPSGLEYISRRDDVVSLKNGPRFVAADRLCDTLGHAGTHKVANAGAPQIVEEFAFVDHLGFRFHLPTIRSVRPERLAVRANRRDELSEPGCHTRRIPRLAKAFEPHCTTATVELETNERAMRLTVAALIQEQSTELRRDRDSAAFPFFVWPSCKLIVLVNKSACDHLSPRISPSLIPLKKPIETGNRRSPGKARIQSVVVGAFGESSTGRGVFEHREMRDIA